jgi:hypothetical protein
MTNMAIRYKGSAATLILGLGLAASPAFAQVGEQGNRPRQQEQPEQQQQQPGADEDTGSQIGGAQKGAYGKQAQGPGIASSVGAPAPQFWLADATLFIGNAANAAHILSMEGAMNIQAPAVLNDQAAFLLAATNRGLSSLTELQQNAEINDPSAVSAIRAAVGQMVAAKATATQAAEAVRAGMLGPTFETNIRAALSHLAGAERAMQSVSRTYGVPQLASAGVCSAGRAAQAFGAGLRGKGISPRGGAVKPQPGKSQPPAAKPPQEKPQEKQPPSEKPEGEKVQPGGPEHGSTPDGTPKAPPK